MVNKDPRTFQNVRVFAGTKSAPAADASYRNLVWENIIGLSGDVKKNTEIGTIRSWGPQFMVSFDLKINSQVSGTKSGWASVLSFKGNGLGMNGRKLDERIPTIFLNKRSLHFLNPEQRQIMLKMKLNQWYSIAVQQLRDQGKVRETEKIHMNMINLLFASFITRSLLMEKK